MQCYSKNEAQKDVIVAKMKPKHLNEVIEISMSDSEYVTHKMAKKCNEDINKFLYVKRKFKTVLVLLQLCQF